MARTALTLVGAGVGAYFGGAQGAQIGAAIGGAVGGIVEAQLAPDTYGPRLDDTSLSPGSYGAPVGINYGIGKFQGERFWVRGNEREARENKQSTGGKGLSGPSYVTTEYFATWAVQICDAPITAIRRVWLGRDLVFDGTSAALEEAINNGDRLPLTGAAENIEMRFYLGTADQQPDPAIQAEDPFAPAMRGLPYIVFEDVALAPWASEIPPVFIEVSSGTPKKLHTGLQSYTTSGDRVAFDGERSRLLQASGETEVDVYDALGGEYLRLDDFSTTQNLWRSSTFGALGDQPETLGDVTAELNTIGPAYAPDGSFYVMTFVGLGGVKSATAEMVDAETGQRIASMSTIENLVFDASFGLGHGASDAVNPRPTDHRLRSVDWLGVDPNTGAQQFLYLRAARQGSIYFGPMKVTDRTPIAQVGHAQVPDYGGGTAEFFCDINRAGTFIFVAYRGSGSTARIARVPMRFVLAEQIIYTETGATPDITKDIAPAIGTIRDCYYNPDADTFTVIGRDGYVIYDASGIDLAEVNSRIFNFKSDAPRARSGVKDGILWFSMEGNTTGEFKDKIVGVSTVTGEIVNSIDLTEWGLTDTNEFDAVWLLRSDIYVAHTGTSIGGDWTYTERPALIFGDRVSDEKIPLADVLSDTALRVGLDAADIDVSAVTTDIWGSNHKATNVTPRGVWEDLLPVYDYFAAPIDGKLTVRPRATTSSGTITDDDLGADGSEIAMGRETDESVPVRRLEFNYTSIVANLDIAQQSDAFPVEVLPDGQIVRATTSAVLDDDEAWNTTQRWMSSASAERTEFTINLPYTRSDIEPGQIWTVSSDNESHDVRVREIQGAGVLKIDGASAWPFLSSAGTPIDTSRPAPTLDEVPATDFELIDSHIWRDEDNTSAVHVVGWPRRAGGNWDGAVLHRSTDPISLDSEFASINSAATVGAATNALGDVVSANFWDRVNTITVRMISGAPENATETAVLEGANPIWVQCGITGEYELIQFATAVENADGTWTLSNLLRGRRGTEHLTGLHLAGDRVIWAEVATVKRRGGSAIGVQHFYASTSVNSRQNVTTKRAFTNRARSLRPLSPVHVRGARDGSGNLTVSWIRRSRIPGTFLKFAVPVGEESESYTIDILDLTGSPSVVRTLTATSESVSYTAAQQTTDFGSTQAQVGVSIRQISATFGAGIEAEATV